MAALDEIFKEPVYVDGIMGDILLDKPDRKTEVKRPNAQDELKSPPPAHDA